MSRHFSSRARYQAAVVALLALLSPVALTAAAHAASTDVGVAVQSPLSGEPGEQRRVYASLSNSSWDESTAPVSVVIAVSGSTVLAIEAAGASCDVPSSTCHFANGLAAGGGADVFTTVSLGVTGSLTATAVLAGGDTNPANDTATTQITVAVPAATALTLSTPPKQPLPAGVATTLLATFTDAAGLPLAYSEIALLRQAVGEAEFVEVDRSYTMESGVASFRIAPTATATYLARYTYRPGVLLASADSAPVAVRVMHAVSAALSPVAVPPGSVVTLTIGARGAPVGTAVTVQQKIGSGPWRSIAHPAVNARGVVNVILRSTVAKVGNYSFRAIRAADAAHEQGLAEAKLVVTTTGKGSAAAWAPLGGSKARPIRWNPCVPITYYVNTRRMPSTGLADVQESVRRVAMTTGLTFRYGGRSAVIPTRGYGGPRGGILFAWATPEETKGLIAARSVGGVGSARSFGRRIVSGHVVINSELLNRHRIPAGFGRGDTQGLILMHELGHVVGLGHVNEPWSVMYPVGGQLPATVWGAGDLVGLKAVGRSAGCLT